MVKNPAPPAVLDTRSLILLLLSACLGLAIWVQLSHVRISAVSLKFDRAVALQEAREYLQKERHVDSSLYLTATTFDAEGDSDRYLQRILGSDAAIKLRAAHDYDMFYWSIRFFIPGQKEEYRVVISSRTGRVIGFKHVLAETTARPDMSQEDAKKVARKFLIEKAGVRLSDYEIKDEVRTARDHRIDYGFSWKHKNVDIPWTKDPEGGTAKLLTGAAVSGGEILAFYKDDISVPDRFNRFLDQEQEVGRNLSMVFGILYIGVIVLAIVQLLRSRHHLATRTVRPFLIRVVLFLAAIFLLSSFNLHESLLSGYPTSQDFSAFVIRAYAQDAISIFFFLVGFVFISLAAESLYAKNSLGNTFAARGSLLFYVRSSFMTRGVFASIIAGYCLTCILLGVQAFIYRFGEQFCGVWSETQWMTQFSTAYWPFLAALAVGLQASLWEEMLFRVFAFNWLKEHLRSVFVAAFVVSLFWGFGHSGYLVFPMWFRGFEVSLLGGIFVWAYLRYGLVTVLVAHFLFDVFWGSASLLFSSSAPLYFWSALAILALPLAWALVAWRLNFSETIRPLDFLFNPAQNFHLKVLNAYISQFVREGGDLKKLRQDCLAHGWDPAVVDKALGIACMGDGS